MQTLNPDLDRLLRTAIKHRRLLRLRYGNKTRVIEPHDYGVHKGKVKLLAFQTGGESTSPLPNWRWMEVNLISHAQLLDQSFAGGRSAASGKHHSWDQVFIRVGQPEDAPSRD